MKSLISILALLAATAPASAEIVSVAIGGRFFPGYSEGYVYGVKDYGAGQDDNTGVTAGDPVNFSAPPIFPWPVDVSFDSPNFGEITGDFTSLASFAVTPAGEFFTLAGMFDNGAGAGFLSVNVVTPGFGISSFGLVGSFAFDPPPIDPPPCVDCGPTPVAQIPETSTWAMLALGIIALWFAALRRGARV